MFLLRAAFWFAIVSVFVPSDFAGDAFELPADLSETRIDAAAPVSQWCEENEALCEAGEEAARLGGFLSQMATERIEAAIESHEENRS
tara:strand:+ start:138 stop:401 length:264 start_codon:yes stop_codon:yes gene_type:complete